MDKRKIGARRAITNLTTTIMEMEVAITTTITVTKIITTTITKEKIRAKMEAADTTEIMARVITIIGITIGTTITGIIMVGITAKIKLNK